MAYDEELADRIRALVAGEPALTEKKMFGGLAFLIRGHMAISASGQGGVLVHVDPERTGELIATTAATVAVMQGREMDGWLRVGADNLATDAQNHLTIPKAAGSVYYFTIKLQQGTVSFPDRAAATHKVLAQAELFAAQTAQKECGSGR